MSRPNAAEQESQDIKNPRHPFVLDVSNFDEIIPYIREPNTLVLCDIDDTALRLKRVGNCIISCPTDKLGFQRMYDHIHQNRCELRFLTARNKVHDVDTREDLRVLDIPNLNHIIIHYTDDRMSKGKYLSHRGIVTKDRPIIFIDDRPEHILSVWRYYPYAKCFAYESAKPPA